MYYIDQFLKAPSILLPFYHFNKETFYTLHVHVHCKSNIFGLPLF